MKDEQLILAINARLNGVTDGAIEMNVRNMHHLFRLVCKLEHFFPNLVELDGLFKSYKMFDNKWQSVIHLVIEIKIDPLFSEECVRIEIQLPK